MALADLSLPEEFHNFEKFWKKEEYWKNLKGSEDSEDKILYDKVRRTSVSKFKAYVVLNWNYSEIIDEIEVRSASY